MSAYDFSNYEDYLNDILKHHDGDRGYRSRLAEAAHVHPSYITRITSGAASLTPDQAVSLADFWGLDAHEKEYFLWMVIKGRASDPGLKKMAEGKLKHLKNTFDELGSLIPAEKMDPSSDHEYYINWIYAAVHMILTLPASHSVERIARRLSIPDTVANATLQQLKKLGLAEQTPSGAYKATKKNIHLSNQSWMAPLQHKNWRIAATERIGRPGLDDVRYTGIHSISKKDLEKLRRQIREFLLDVDKLVRPSPEETVFAICLDVFEL